MSTYLQLPLPEMNPVKPSNLPQVKFPSKLSPGLQSSAQDSVQGLMNKIYHTWLGDLIMTQALRHLASNLCWADRNPDLAAVGFVVVH